MEPEVIEFLKRVTLSIFLAFLWLAINTTIGIKFNLAFVEEKVTIGNVFFYIWLVTSFILLLFFFIRLWREALKA